MDEHISLFIPLNHIKTSDIYDRQRFTIFPNNYVQEHRIFQFDDELNKKLFQNNFRHITNDFCTFKIPRMGGIDKNHLYKLSYALIKINRTEFEHREDIIAIIKSFYAVLRVFDVHKNSYESKRRLWSEWQRPYNYSYFSFLYTNDKLVDILELDIKKLSLDINLDNLNSEFDCLLEKVIKNASNERLAKLVNFYNKIYGLIIDKNFKDANLYCIFLLEYLYCNSEDELKSKTIAEKLKTVLDKEEYSETDIEEIIKTAYRVRSQSVHQYKGLSVDALYNFNLYYFNPLEQLLVNGEIKLFLLFLAINKIIMYEINHLEMV